MLQILLPLGAVLGGGAYYAYTKKLGPFATKGALQNASSAAAVAQAQTAPAAGGGGGKAAGGGGTVAPAGTPAQPAAGSPVAPGATPGIATPSPQTAKVTTRDPAPSGDLTIHSSPSQTAPLIGSIDKNGIVTILNWNADGNNMWAQVSWAGGRKPAGTGYSLRQYLVPQS